MKNTVKKFLLGALVLAVAVCLSVMHGGVTEVSAEERNPADVIADYVARVQGGELGKVYEESFSVMVHKNSQEEYEKALHQVYDGLTSVQYKVLTDTADVKEYALFSNNKRIANLREQKKADGTWAVATVFKTMKTYIIEAETGKTVRVNGTVLGDSEQLSKASEATNLSGLGYTKADLLVDTYRVQNMINEPEITVDGVKKSASIVDVTCDTVYVGEDLTSDQELSDMIIQYAEICAMYPARDIGLGSVASISLTDSNWYSRISEVQSDWFTAHSAPTFSNEKVLKIVKQGDDTIVANVIFDFYATNGEVSRTWVCGYQMTLVNVGGTWLIGGMGVDSTLNPHSEYYKD